MLIVLEYIFVMFSTRSSKKSWAFQANDWRNTGCGTCRNHSNSYHVCRHMQVRQVTFHKLARFNTQLSGWYQEFGTSRTPAVTSCVRNFEVPQSVTPFVEIHGIKGDLKDSRCMSLSFTTESYGRSLTNANWTLDSLRFATPMGNGNPNRRNPLKSILA